MDYFHKMDTPFSAVLAFKLLFDLLSFDLNPTACVERFRTEQQRTFFKNRHILYFHYFAFTVFYISFIFFLN